MANEYETDYEVGQHNVRFFGFEVHNPVFFVASILIIVLVVFTLAFQQQAAAIFEEALNIVTSRFGWLMASLANFFVLFSIALIVSPYGSVRLGGPDARPDFGYMAWFAMLFAAGMGIGLVFFGVSEPISHFSASFAADAGGPASYSPLGGAPGDAAASKQLGMAATIFHWTLHPWAVYVIVGLALALFSYNFGLPLTIRSGFYPIFGDLVWGTLGNVIDGVALVATVFGLATSLGFGAQQSLAGLNFLFGLEINAVNQVILVFVIASITLLSLFLGLDRGVRRLSEINMALAAMLCLFVVAAGPTVMILLDFPKNIAAYIGKLPALSNMFGRSDKLFYHDWTIFYWAWWTAWAPFVGMFIARISRGRTVREFVFYVLLVPSIVSTFWFTAFGTVAIDQIVTHGYNGAAEAKLPLKLFFMLEELPLTQITSVIGITLVLIFFVTSWDSGALVLDTIAAGGKIDTHKLQRVFWVGIVGSVAIALLLGGGLRSLQSGANVTGLPFMIVVAVMCVGVVKGLHEARRRQRRLQDTFRSEEEGASP
ncbi:MAG: BCCT family transporter [Parvularculaceae bacterium]